MSGFIDRHIQPDADVAAEELADFDELWPDVKEGLHQRPAELLGSQISKAVRAFTLSVVAQKPDKPPLRYLQMAAQVGIGNFEGASNPGQTFSREIDGELFHFKGERTTAFMDTDSWQLAFFSALAAGIKAGVEVLSLVPASVHQQANIKPDAFDLAFVAMLKGLFDPSANMGSLLVAANEAANAGSFSADRAEYATHIMTPQLALYRGILSSAEAEFNQSLEDAVLKHKEFWGTKARAHKVEGWVALPLLAVCRLARDHKKFRVSVETDYIPKL